MATPCVNKTKEYVAWMAIRNRCFNKSCSKYKYYGGRGITMCERWFNSFQDFLTDVGPAPSSKHSSDRFPNANGNYEPSNFRWATREEQDRNKNNNIFIEYNGIKLIMRDWEKILNMPVKSLRYWYIIKGYSLPQIIKIKGITI